MLRNSLRFRLGLFGSFLLVVGLAAWIARIPRGAGVPGAELTHNAEDLVWENPSASITGSKLQGASTVGDSGPRSQVPEEAMQGVSDSAASSRGVVVDRTHGWPIPEARVSWWCAGRIYAETRTDELGRFECTLPDPAGLEAGPAEWSVQGPSVAEVTRIPIAPKAQPSEWRLQVPGLARLRGLVAFADSAPLWEASYTLVQGADTGPLVVLASGSMGDEGEFQILVPVEALLEPLTLFVQHPTHCLSQKPIRVTGLDQDLGVVSLETGWVLRGRVESPFPQELRSQRLWVERVAHPSEVSSWGSESLVRWRDGWTQRLRSIAVAADGSFEASGLRPGRYRLRPIPPGAEGRLFPLDVEAHGEVEVDLAEGIVQEPIVLKEWWALVEVEVLGADSPTRLRSLPLMGSLGLPEAPQGVLWLDPDSRRGWLAVEPMHRSTVRVGRVDPWTASDLEVPAVPAGQWMPAQIVLRRVQ
ncbi:MAG TPA: hypothetical protein PLJ12_09670, partial [Planctomycetota bacterium]|nr:hypothetical protein [Planctomycetota bacterium]